MKTPSSKILLIFACAGTLISGVFFLGGSNNNTSDKDDLSRGEPTPVSPLSSFVPKPSKQDIALKEKKEYKVLPLSEPLIEEVEAEEPEAPFDQEAIQSMEDARINGDPRAPSISRSKPRELPTQDELDDPDLYLGYQARQRQKLITSYIKAAKPKINNLKELVAEGEAGGISEEQLEEGRMKIRELEAMVEELKLEMPE